MERTMTDERTDWESLLDFSPADAWQNDGPHWADDLPDLALPLESLGLGEAAPALPVGPEEQSAVGQTLSARMKLGVAASVLVHGLLLGAALASLYWVAPLEAGDVESVAVDIIETQSVSANSTSSVEAEAVEAMVSSGAQAVEPVEAETIEEMKPAETAMAETPTPVEVEEITQPVEEVKPETAEPVTEATPVETQQPVETDEVAEPTPVEAASVAAEVPLLAAAAVSPVPPLETVAPIKPVNEAQPIDPIETAVVPETVEAVTSAAPVPLTRTVKQVAEPTYPKTTPKKPEPKTPAPKAAEQPTKKPVKDAAPPKKQVASAGGNGGQNEIDTQASAQSSASKGSSGGGGGAADAYPAKVRGKLQRAMRYRGSAGEAKVQFTISANGSVSSVGIVASSGNSALDEAVIAAVRRAAPFPPIPAEAGRSSWTLAMPIKSLGRG